MQLIVCIMKTEQAFLALAKAIKNHGEPICATTDPELFFPPVGNEDGVARQAKKLCQTCPVIKECLTYALVNQEQFGIWGGMSPRERMAMRRAGKGRPKTVQNVK
jgi:WhiB family redox-sensing transcriptional regulator